MGNSEEPKSRGIPIWQGRGSSASETPKEDYAKASEQGEFPDERRQSLLENAAKFLEDKDIRNAPVERKKFFLGSKGLTEDEIQGLLQEQEQEQEEDQHTPEAEVMEDYGMEKEALQLQFSRSAPVLEATVEGKPSSPAPSTSDAPSNAASAREGDQVTSNSTSKDVPPIITYPEFLLHSQKPPPLITARRLLNTVYFASGAAATLYGTSKYIVEPMIESLTIARQSLADTALSNLNALNSKLERAVSKTPDILDNGDGKDDSDTESFDSDPSRFFSRSAGTQTSPCRSRSTSSTSLEALPTTDLGQSHESTLSAIHSKLSDIKPTDTDGPVKNSIMELSKFLDGLRHANTIPRNGRLWGEAKSDEYGKLKAEIRGVKGVLLSARNFPSGVPVR